MAVVAAIDATDDIAQVQTLVDGISSCGGGELVLRGVYKPAFPLLARNNVTIRTDSYAELIRMSTNHLIHLNGASNFKVRGIFLNGNNTMTTAYRGIFGAGTDIDVLGCKFDGWNNAHPLALTGGSGYLVKDNRIGDCGGFGSEGGISNASFINNYFFEPTTDYALMAAGNMARNNNILIQGNQIPFGSVNAGGGIDVVAHNAIIRDNIIKNAHLNGIFVHDNYDHGGSDAVSNIILGGNIIEDTKPTNGARSIVVRNHSTAAVANISINNNLCDKSLTLNRINKARVTGNSLRTNPIYFLEGDDTSITDNDIFNATNAFNVEATMPYLKNSSITGNRVQVTGGAFVGGRLPVDTFITNNPGLNAPVPATSTSSGVVGQYANDNDYMYVCVAANTWKRTPLSW